MKKFINAFQKKILSLLPFLIVTGILSYFIVYLTNQGGTKLIEKDLITIVPIFLTLNFVFLIVLFAFNFKEIWRELRSINKNSLIFLSSIVLVGFILRMFVVPHTHRILFDEDLYLSMGRTMLLEGRGCLCNYGTADGKCLECFNYKDPKGYPFILAVLFLIFGISETVAFNFMVIISTLSIVLTFLISRFLFKNDKIALYSSLFFALSPLHIIWSGTVASEPLLLFFIMSSVWLSLLLVKHNSLKMFLFFMVFLAFTLQIKTDGFILLALITLSFIIFNDKLIKKLKNVKFFLLPLLLFFLVAGPFLIHFYYFSTTNDWEAPNGKKFTFEYGNRNIPENFTFLIAGEKGIEQPYIYIIFSLIGMFYAFKKYRKSFSFLMIWLLLFFLMYGFFFAGSVLWGSNERYALTYYTPLIFFAGVGLNFVNNILDKKLKRASSVLLLFLVSISFLLCLPTIATPADKIEEAIQSRTYHDFVVSKMDSIDKDCFVLSHVPSIFLVYGKNSGQPWFIDRVNTDCIIFDQGYWCNVDPFRAPNSICNVIHNTYKISLLSEYDLSKYGHVYTLYYVLK